MKRWLNKQLKYWNIESDIAIRNNLPFNTLSSFCFSNCRGDPHTATRGGQQVPLLLPDTTDSTQRGGLPGAVPRPHHPPRQADPQHGHHDVHLWGGGLSAWPLAQPPLSSKREGDSSWPSCTLFGFGREWGQNVKDDQRIEDVLHWAIRPSWSILHLSAACRLAEVGPEVEHA